MIIIIIIIWLLWLYVRKIIWPLPISYILTHLYTYTYVYIYVPNVILLQQQFHLKRSIFGLTNTIRPFEFKSQCIVPKNDHKWCWIFYFEPTNIFHCRFLLWIIMLLHILLYRPTSTSAIGKVNYAYKDLFYFNVLNNICLNSLIIFLVYKLCSKKLLKTIYN